MATDTNRSQMTNNAADKNLHIFCIGGSGLRVFRSLIMLMASGYGVDGYCVKPYLIDPHLQSKELSEVSDLIAKYTKVFRGTNEGFFKTQVSADLSNLNVMNSTSINDKSFGEFIGASACKPGTPEALLIDMLYSKKNLDTSMSVGFKGSPNVGSVVFQNFINSKWFKAFKPEPNDRVILIGSLFGGTGASGIPSIAKAFKEKNTGAKLAAIALTPYYELAEPKENAVHREINSQNFESKSYAALKFYDKDPSVFDRFYVVGDSLKKRLPYDEEKQGNDAHFIELVAAMAAKDFAETPEDGLTPATRWDTFVIDENKNVVNYNNAGVGMNACMNSLGDMLSFAKLFFLMQNEKFYPFYHYYKNHFASDEFTALSQFIYNDSADKYSFIQWLGELSGGDRAQANDGRSFNAIDVHDISAPERDAQINHYRFIFDEKFTLFNKEQNPYSGNKIISRQFLKINDSFRKIRQQNQQCDAISDFLNASYDGIRKVNLNCFKG